MPKTYYRTAPVESPSVSSNTIAFSHWILALYLLHRYLWHLTASATLYAKAHPPWLPLPGTSKFLFKDWLGFVCGITCLLPSFKKRATSAFMALTVRSKDLQNFPRRQKSSQGFCFQCDEWLGASRDPTIATTRSRIGHTFWDSWCLTIRKRGLQKSLNCPEQTN